MRMTIENGAMTIEYYNGNANRFIFVCAFDGGVLKDDGSQEILFLAFAHALEIF